MPMCVPPAFKDIIPELVPVSWPQRLPRRIQLLPELQLAKQNTHTHGIKSIKIGK